MMDTADIDVDGHNLPQQTGRDKYRSDREPGRHSPSSLPRRPRCLRKRKPTSIVMLKILRQMSQAS